MRELAVDIHFNWQEPYKDDNIEEGFKKPIMVIQQAARGEDSYFDPDWGQWTSGGVKVQEKFLTQRESIESFEIKIAYTWIETESGHTVEEHAQAMFRAIRDGDYNGAAFDFEAYNNVISKSTIFKLLQIVERFRELMPECPIMIYSNKWIFDQMVFYLTADWLNQFIIWAAGGSLYNKQIASQPDDDYHIFEINGLIIEVEQFSADGNRLADEFDFGTSETASIDINLINIPRDELLSMFHIGDLPAPLPSDCNCDVEIQTAWLNGYNQAIEDATKAVEGLYQG